MKLYPAVVPTAFLLADGFVWHLAQARGILFGRSLGSVVWLYGQESHLYGCRLGFAMQGGTGGLTR